MSEDVCVCDFACCWHLVPAEELRNAELKRFSAAVQTEIASCFPLEATSVAERVVELVDVIAGPMPRVERCCRCKNERDIEAGQ